MLAALAVRRVHVMVLPAPGAEMLGMRAAAAVRRRGWIAEASARDADAVLLCGRGDDEWTAAADSVWRSVPPPHARRRVEAQDAIGSTLDGIAGVLADPGRQSGPRPPRGSPTERPVGGSMVAVRFGPILPDWPVGLVVDCAVHRGAVLAADARLLTGTPIEDPLDGPSADVLRICVRAVGLLRSGGWEAEALRLEHRVDRVLGGEPVVRHRSGLRRTLRRARGSMILRANLRHGGVDSRAALLELLGTAIRICDEGSSMLGDVSPAAVAAHLLGRPVRDVPVAVATWMPAGD